MPIKPNRGYSLAVSGSAAGAGSSCAGAVAAGVWGTKAGCAGGSFLGDHNVRAAGSGRNGVISPINVLFV